MSSALLTDHYELTMVAAALRNGAAGRRCVFETFARRLPDGRRYGVVAGIDRLMDLLDDFRFGERELAHLTAAKIVDERTCGWLADFRFSGDIDGYREGELYFAGSPVLTVEAPFAEGVLLETLVLSVLNHDSAIASAAARMVCAAGERPIIEMGSRRTHERAAVAAARAAYLAGFTSTSNLEAGRRHGIPTAGTSAHAFVLLHDTEAEAYRGQLQALGPATTLLVDTFDIAEGIRLAVALAGPELGAIRIDSGELAVLARQSRRLLDDLGASGTRIVVSGDLDEFSIAALAVAPVDAYGVGTALVAGSGHPTAEMIYKLVEVDGRPVAKRSHHKTTRGGRKTATRRHKATGTATEELIGAGRPELGPYDRLLQVPLVRGGRRVDATASLAEARRHLREVMVSVPWEGLKLAPGEPAIPTVYG